MAHPDDEEEEELLRLVSEAFDAEIGEPPDHLVEAAKALMHQGPPRPGSAPEPQDPQADDGAGDELAGRRVHRLERTMAAAAATSSRRLSAAVSSADGSIITEMTENDEGHLVVTIRSPDASLLYVAMGWTLISAQGRRRRYRLVTPLTSDRSGLCVHYDLGPLDASDAVELEPAEEVFVTDVGPADVALALRLATTGAARRAWTRAEEIHRANGDPLADVIRTGTAP